MWEGFAGQRCHCEVFPIKLELVIKAAAGHLFTITETITFTCVGTEEAAEMRRGGVEYPLTRRLWRLSAIKDKIPGGSRVLGGVAGSSRW